jgi:hypothetical protein
LAVVIGKIFTLYLFQLKDCLLVAAAVVAVVVVVVVAVVELFAIVKAGSADFMSFVVLN